ncbi:MAG: translation initiation factor IF-2 [Planctomycetota bacterium]|nr:translation initiation factor IF-2 [Planctomycetota bacterium]
MAKGIRVNLLAKELGVESKLILQKLKEEGLSDVAPNHMSTLSIGLAESVREWFSSAQQGGGTAVETAPPIETATKVKAARTRKKKEETETSDDDVLATTLVAEAPAAAPVERDAPQQIVEPPTPIEVETPAIAITRPAPATHKSAAVATRPMPAPVAPAAQAPVDEELPAEPIQEAPIAVPETIAPQGAPPAAEAPPAVGKPAKVAASASSSATPQSDHVRPTRPTVTLANRAGTPPPIERRPVVQAPQLTSLQPAKIQGPRVVRIEKEEVDARGPRPQRPAGGGPANESSSSPGVAPATPRGGRGVRVTEDDEEDAKKKAANKKGASLSSRRRGVDGRRGEAMEKLKEFTDADLIARRDALNAAATSRNVFDSHLRQIEKRGTHAQAKSIVQRGEPVPIEEPITVKSLAAALGVKSNDIISKLMKQGVFATVNQGLETSIAETMALEFGIELQIAKQATLEEVLINEIDTREVDSAKLQPRPPVVTILGHVDHGKTSLLDKIRNANVAAGEAGGITQHTAAWMVQLGDKRVTFIDTPGHQAFTSMRARGANMTDIVVLVVSAAEGVQPQTIESINHAKAAGVPIVVALNKIDRSDANPDMVLGQLAKEGLNPIEWGGDVEVIRTSATTGQGVPELIEILDLQAQVMDLKADPTAPARGTVIESRMDEGLGPVATVLIQDGTLKISDIGLSGTGYGRIRSLLNDRFEMIEEAGPSTPVIVSGLSQLPNAGDQFYGLQDLDRVRAITEERQSMTRQSHLASSNKVTLDTLFDTMKAGEIKTINLIIKGDVQGSVETLAKTVTDANTSEVRVRVIHSAVGGISESDVELADASKAVIIGFHVVPDESARQMAEQRRVEIRLYRVIYEIFDDLKKALSGLLEPEVREKLHGHAEIRKVYKVSKIGNVAGCFVTDGHIQRGSKIRLSRDGIVITEDLTMESLKRLKDDVKEVKAGFECGIKLNGYDDVKIGDILEAYIRETFQRTL